MPDVPSKRFRASDDDRDAVLTILQQAYAAGRITVDELAERQEAALGAKYLDVLPDLVEDLPEGSALAVRPGNTPAARPGTPLPAASPEATTLTFMSGKDVDLAPGTTLYRNFAWWGGDTINVVDAMGPGVVLTLELHCIMAGHDILVPEGVRVIDESLAIMAGNDIAKDARGDGSNGTLILKGFLWWAGSDVKLASAGK